MDILAALSMFISLHQVDGRKVLVNPRWVIQLVEPRSEEDPARGLIEGVECILFFTTGKYLSVVETCDKVRTLMEEMLPPEDDNDHG